MQIVFEDTDLEELITTGRNNKYKKYTPQCEVHEGSRHSIQLFAVVRAGR